MYEFKVFSRMHRLGLVDACFRVPEPERRTLRHVWGKHTRDCSIVNQQMYLGVLLQKPPGKAPDGGHRAQVHLAKQEAGPL